MFNTATTLDPGMCDAWLARMLAGEQSIDVLAGAWAAVRTFGWETRRLGVTDLQFRPEVSDGLFLRLAVTSVESLACAYAAVLAEAKRYEEAAKLLDGVEPRHPFDEEAGQLRAGRAVLPHRTLARRARPISRGKDLAAPRTEGRGRGDGHHGAGVTGSLRGGLPARRRTPSRATGCRGRPTSPCTPRACACATSAGRRRPSSCCAGCIHGIRSSARPAKRWTTPTIG